MKISEEPHLFVIACCAVVGFFAIISAIMQLIMAVVHRMEQRHHEDHR